MKNIKKTISILVISAFICAIFPVDKALCISVQKEKELSRKIMKVIFRYYDIIDDQIIADYIQKIGDKIVSVLPPQPFEYKFYVLKEYDYNAFATPAGHIFINSGLFSALSTEDELAGVLAHEIAHTACRHISKKIERSKKINLASLAGIITGILLGPGAVASAVIMGSAAAGHSASLAYSRHDEMQADELALKYLAKAGYNQKGLVESLKELRTKEWFGKEQIPSYLRTHYSSEDRIAYLGSILSQNKKAVKSDNYEFKKIRARLSALYGQKQITLIQLKANAENFPHQSAANYGYALILARIGKLDDSITYLKKALKQKPLEPCILADMGRVYFADGRLKNAEQILQKCINLDPDNIDANFFLARIETSLKKYAEAIIKFKKVISINPNYNKAFYFLANAYSKTGRQDLVHFYLGIYFNKIYDIKNSRFHLNKAIKLLKNPEFKSNAEKILESLNQIP